MVSPITPVTVQPISDDQKHKRDVMRAIQELIDHVAALETQVAYLKNRVN